MPYGWNDAELRDERRRRETVLVLRGAGLNFWQYLPFLRSFRLSELSQFEAIYTISGSSLLIWLYSVMDSGRVAETAAAEYDHAMRAGLNRRGWLSRTAGLLRGSYLYRAEDFLQVFDLLTAPGAWTRTLAELPLRNWRIVAQEESLQDLLLLSPESHPAFAVGEVISRAVTWTKMLRRPFCSRTPYHGLLIGDFDFAGSAVRRDFYDHLHRAHPRAPVYHINLFKNGARGSDRFVRVGGGRFPRIWQILDFAAFYFGVPNPRYRRAAIRTLNSPATHS